MRVVIAEDNALLADGLARLLQAHGHEVVASVTTGPDMVAAVAEHRPDVAVVDIRLPPGFTDEGLRAAVEPSDTDHRRVRAVLAYLGVNWCVNP